MEDKKINEAKVLDNDTIESDEGQIWETSGYFLHYKVFDDILKQIKDKYGISDFKEAQTWKGRHIYIVFNPEDESKIDVKGFKSFIESCLSKFNDYGAEFKVTFVPKPKGQYGPKSMYLDIHFKNGDSFDKDKFIKELGADLKKEEEVQSEETPSEEIKEDLEFDAMEDLKSEVYHALSEIYAKYNLKGATLNDLDGAVEFATIHMRDEFDESLKEDKEEDSKEEAPVEEPKAEEPAKEDEEPKLETFEDKMNFLIGDEDEAIAGYDKIIAMLDEEEDANAIAQLKHVKDEEVAHKDFLEVLKGDKEAVYEHEEEKEDEPVDVEAEMEVVDLDDVDDDFGMGESLDEDTVKKGDKWVNKGDEGEHGEFKTKKEADAQRKAMFANGYHEEVEEDIDDDFGTGTGHFIAEEAEEMGITVDWDDMEDDVDDEDAETFKKVIKNTDDDILDNHFGKDTPERKLVGAIKDMDEEAHETGHIKAKKPIELRARR